MKLILLIVTILLAVNDILGSYNEKLQEKQSNDGLSDQIPQVFAGVFAVSLGLSLPRVKFFDYSKFWLFRFE